MSGQSIGQSSWPFDEHHGFAEDGVMNACVSSARIANIEQGSDHWTSS